MGKKYAFWTTDSLNLKNAGSVECVSNDSLTMMGKQQSRSNW